MAGILSHPRRRQAVDGKHYRGKLIKVADSGLAPPEQAAENSDWRGFCEGHDFSRAVKSLKIYLPFSA
jgi:hypothetical protein